MALRKDPVWCMCEEGLVKDPESRAERDSEERKREHVRGHRKEVRKKTELYRKTSQSGRREQ